MGAGVWIAVGLAVAWSVAWARARAARAEVQAAWRHVDALLVGRHALAAAVAEACGSDVLREACEAARAARSEPPRVPAAEAALEAALGDLDTGRHAGAIEDLDARIDATRRLHAHLVDRYRSARRLVPGAGVAALPEGTTWPSDR